MLRSLRPVAFTLVELLVVITVIGILATVTAVNYMTALKTAKLNRSADTVISFIKEARLKTVAGFKAYVPGQSAEFKCFGLRFKETAGEIEMFMIHVPYIVQDLNGSCGQSDQIVEDQAINIDSMVKVGAINDQTNNKNLDILFIPPAGEIMTLPATNSIKISLLYNNEASDSIFVRQVKVDTVTGRIYVERE